MSKWAQYKITGCDDMWSLWKLTGNYPKSCWENMGNSSSKETLELALKQKIKSQQEPVTENYFYDGNGDLIK